MGVQHLVLFGVLAALALAIAEGLAHSRLSGIFRTAWPVYPKPVMSEAERAFYSRLCAAVPQFPVFCQVQLCRFIEVQDVARRLEVLNRYARLSADFLVCNEDLQPALVIELDDASHDTAAQRVRDAKKDAVLAAAGVPILRCRGLPCVERMRQEVLKAMRGPAERKVRPEEVHRGGRKVPYIGSL